MAPALPGSGTWYEQRQGQLQAMWAVADEHGLPDLVGSLEDEVGADEATEEDEY